MTIDISKGVSEHVSTRAVANGFHGDGITHTPAFDDDDYPNGDDDTFANPTGLSVVAPASTGTESGGDTVPLGTFVAALSAVSFVAIAGQLLTNRRHAGALAALHPAQGTSFSRPDAQAAAMPDDDDTAGANPGLTLSGLTDSATSI